MYHSRWKYIRHWLSLFCFCIIYLELSTCTRQLCRQTINLQVSTIHLQTWDEVAHKWVDQFGDILFSQSHKNGPGRQDTKIKTDSISFPQAIELIYYMANDMLDLWLPSQLESKATDFGRESWPEWQITRHDDKYVPAKSHPYQYWAGLIIIIVTVA